MQKGVPRIVLRIRRAVARGGVRFTLKAAEELETLGLSRQDAADVLARLTVADYHRRVASGRDWLRVFKPHVGSVVAYLKIALGRHCVVVSFHEDDVGGEAESR